MDLRETLEKVQKMRNQVNNEIKEGKTPSIDTKTIDLIERTVKNSIRELNQKSRTIGTSADCI